jgi:23S rRNA pseudouridine2605 synthase
MVFAYNEPMSNPIRLQKFLASAGVNSRRRCEELILAGVVTVNGTIVRELGSRVDPATDRVTVHGQPVHAPEQWEYVVLNKPRGYLVTREDTHGRPTIYDLLPPQWDHLHAVGRLDYDSSGLLLLTNHGELTQRLLHPRYKVEKAYTVVVNGTVSPEDLAALRGGVDMEEGGRSQPAYVEVLSVHKTQTRLEFRIKEGKKRQIRYMCQARGLRVIFLDRYRFGPLELHDLPQGEARALTPRETQTLLGAVFPEV